MTIRTLTPSILHRRDAAPKVALIGAPTDLGSGQTGAALGPAALRDAGLAAALRRRGFMVSDRGDAGVVNTPGRRVDGCEHLNEVAASCQAVRDAVGAALVEGQLPLLMGGDHSLAIGSLAAVARHCAAAGRPLSVLWLDAHTDFNTPDSSPSSRIYGMPVAVAAGEGHAALLGLGHAVPMIDVGRFALIGARSIDPLEAERVRARGLRVHTMADVRRRGIVEVTEEALAAAARDGAHLHVSFDVDFLDPEVAPGTGLTEPDGPSLGEAEACLRLVADSGLLGSFDLVELAPAMDPSGATARRVIGLVEQAFAPVPAMARKKARRAVGASR
jgi:arginase